MAQSLFEHGQIRTTLAKAKDLRPFVERLITLARRASGGTAVQRLVVRQRLIAELGDRAMIPKDSLADYESMSDAGRRRVLRSRSGRRYRLGQARGGQKFTAVSIVHHLITNVAPQFADRAGGYTRVIKLPRTARGDNAPLAVLQLVGREESPGTVVRPEKSARQRRTERRYAAAAKAIRTSPQQRRPADGDATTSSVDTPAGDPAGEEPTAKD